MFTIKHRPDDTINIYKTRSVARGFTKTYGVDNLEIFSSAARLNSIHILFSLVVNHQWLMFQLDMKTAFLYGNLEEV